MRKEQLWPYGQLFNAFPLTRKWRNYWILQPPEITLFTDAESFQPPGCINRAICSARPVAINPSHPFIFLSFLFALWPWRVVLTHATVIISHSDIQMRAEKALFAHVQLMTRIHQGTAGMKTLSRFFFPLFLLCKMCRFKMDRSEAENTEEERPNGREQWSC